MNSNPQDLDGKDSDVFDPRELNVLSEKKNSGLFCKREDDLYGFFQSMQNVEKQKNKTKLINKNVDWKCKKCDISFSGRKYWLEHRKEVHWYKYIPTEDRIKIKNQMPLLHQSSQTHIVDQPYGTQA